jgi:parallel beta-helix repeat protein
LRWGSRVRGYYDVPGSTQQCGCSGGGKFWVTVKGTVTGNSIHNNLGVGIRVDTNKAGFNISRNYISDNWREGIVYENSDNAQIENSTLGALGRAPYGSRTVACTW